MLYKERVEKSAQAVLDARAYYQQTSEVLETSEVSPAVSLADLYDPSAIPKILVDTHRALNKAVDLCYHPETFKTELERLEFLFALYRQYTEPMNFVMEGKKKRKKK